MTLDPVNAGQPRQWIIVRSIPTPSARSCIHHLCHHEDCGICSILDGRSQRVAHHDQSQLPLEGSSNTSSGTCLSMLRTGWLAHQTVTSRFTSINEQILHASTSHPSCRHSSTSTSRRPGSTKCRAWRSMQHPMFQDVAQLAITVGHPTLQILQT